MMTDDMIARLKELLPGWRGDVNPHAGGFRALIWRDTTDDDTHFCIATGATEAAALDAACRRVLRAVEPPAPPTEHDLTLSGQPIMDGWTAECACGWRAAASFWDFPERDQLLAELRRRHAEHVAAGGDTGHED